MKCIVGFSVIIIFVVQPIFAQDSTYIQRPAIGIHLTYNRFVAADSIADRNKFGIALDYLHGFTPRTDLHATVAGSFISFSNKGSGNNSKRLLLEVDGSIREKLFPGHRSVNPFLQAGVGVSSAGGQLGLFLPVGAGVQVSLPGETFILFQAQYRAGLTNDQPGHFYLSAGIAGIIGKKKRPHSVPARAAAVTLPSAGDADGDGIPDDQDECPNQPGMKAFNGCPDTDGDGIPDKNDKCPLVKGLSRLGGCPESDRDKDGVSDAEDRCPDLPGFRENQGCPAIGADLQSRIDLAARSVFFETDKYVLLPASYPALDTVASILRGNKYLHLEIRGHTDSTGTPDNNKTLSQQRAQAVLDYLARSIDRTRLSSAGYGSERPVATNQTPEGRAKNRRTEMRVKY